MPVFLSGPTPVELAPRLAAELGLRANQLLIKRDDLIGLGGGGNKVRKLQVTMGDALQAGATTVVTTGAVQSNHARLTAAAAARLGLHAVLVLDGHSPTQPAGNVLLEEILGAELVFAGVRDVEEVVQEVVARGAVHRIPFGGTSPRSADAYREAGLELLAQVPDVGNVVVALGSGGTMAGLVAALGPDHVLGVHTGAVEDPSATVAHLLGEMGVAGGDRLRIDRAHVGDDYDAPGPEVREALLLTARTEGVILDPIYTARAMAALITAARRGEFDDEPVVFWHTGGMPGLFGRPDLVRAGE